MPSDIQHNLLQLEMQPPGDAWQNIASRLDREFDVIEGKLSDRIAEAFLEPPANTWQNINKALGDSKYKGKVIHFNFKQLAIAAVIIGLIGTAVFYYVQTQMNPESTGVVSNNKTAPDSVKKTRIQPATEEVTISTDLGIADNIPQTAALFRGPRRSALPLQVNSPEGFKSSDNYNEPELQSAANQIIQMEDATKEAVVNAPLIRDANGKVIMDMSLLITKPGNYITVTGPNGEQTHISSKFANFLASLNNYSSNEKEDYFDFLIFQSAVWKKRFEDWREKILQQANFFPSSATFFDVLELKDLIKD